jgi:hypothetical protein
VAYGYYELAVQQCGRKLKDREAYDWLVENPQKLEGEELPEFETFRRYLTAYRNAHNISKYSAKRGRSHGPSVVRQNEL